MISKMQAACLHTSSELFYVGFSNQSSFSQSLKQNRITCKNTNKKKYWPKLVTNKTNPLTKN